MINRIQEKYQIAWALGMVILLAIAACIPTAGGLLQQRHRTVRQNLLRREKNDAAAVQITIPDSLVTKCFFAEENELLLDNLRYDVTAIQHIESYVVFTAVPDLKETQLCQLTAGSLLLPTLFKHQKQGINTLLYVCNSFTICLLPLGNLNLQSVFFQKRITVSAGFEWCYVPPPDKRGC